MEEMTIDDVIFEYELKASDKCNGDKRYKYKLIFEWLKEYKKLCEKEKIDE